MQASGLNLIHLQTFIAVAQERSFSRASQRLFLAQPTVSAHIQSLEAFYGVRLFRRTSKMVELTPAGSKLLDYALHIQGLVQEARAALESVAHTDRLSLGLGASQTLGNYVVPAVLGELWQARPEVRIHLQIGNSSAILARLEAGEIDVALLEGAYTPGGCWRQWPWMADTLALVVGPRHPWAGRGRVTTEELTQPCLLLREPGSATRETVLAALKAAGLPLERLRYQELGSIEAIKRAVADGLGVSFLSPWAVRREVAEGRLAMVTVEGLPLTRAFTVVARPEVQDHPLGRWFLDALASGRAQPAAL
ncbi:LysR family transcriptional regulator [Candidatus Hydrogenisulfobacillus filiaventi]|uniref:LysR family transcriptional regulator n=1 Tax=Candidatus Hydrogenisulfobacillus filiaventi TaxID=2707344 RepID=A0A6F8ZHE6_9FIRM|nr:LysR substrate-binding domain-containing protein [Bacillota bacterium]CAB1129307.1 LysR family transcriptional regulator [Candidatus Hydrogenisulfobacillus filiaventi]